MAFDFAQTKYLETDMASAGVSQVPMTLAAWARQDQTVTSANSFFLSVGEKVNNHRLHLGITTAGQYVISHAGSSGVSVFAPYYPTLGSWSHYAGVFTSLSSRNAYYNGTAATPNTVSIASANSPTHIQVGARYITTINADFIGAVADVGIWNVALTADEIASLAKGVACDKIRPGDLVFYAPLVRGLIDVTGGLTITNNNTATVSDHPRLYL